MIVTAVARGDCAPYIRKLDDESFIVFPTGIMGGTVSMTVRDWDTLVIAVEAFLTREGLRGE